MQLKPTETEILSCRDYRDDGYREAMKHAQYLIDGDISEITEVKKREGFLSEERKHCASCKQKRKLDSEQLCYECGLFTKMR